MSSPLVFIDTETTGLDLTDDIWEFAAIRGNPNGTSESLHLFIEHSDRKCQRLPESFRSDHNRRFPARNSDRIVTQAEAANAIADILRRDGDQRPHIVGAVPNFDTERLALMLSQFGRTPQWHHHLIDVENLAVGWLAGRGTPLPPPWDSNDLSRAVGVDPDMFARHTAMGDVLWAAAIYERVMEASE